MITQNVVIQKVICRLVPYVLVVYTFRILKHYCKLLQMYFPQMYFCTQMFLYLYGRGFGQMECCTWMTKDMGQITSVGIELKSVPTPQPEFGWKPDASCDGMISGLQLGPIAFLWVWIKKHYARRRHARCLFVRSEHTVGSIPEFCWNWYNVFQALTDLSGAKPSGSDFRA